MAICDEPFKNIRKMEGQVRGRQEAEDQEKRWWTELCQLANIILVTAPTYDLDIFILATLEFERNAWAFWLENNICLEQLSFNAWTIRMAIIEFLAVTILMTVKNEYLTYEDISKGIHDDEHNVCL